MPRPRIHDLDELMDAAERIAIESDATAVTVRALSERTDVSNGAIYHAFGSRAGLLGAVWLRAAQRFLAVQSEAVDAVTNHPHSSPVDAVIAAADAPAAFLLGVPLSGRFLLAVRRHELLRSDDLPAETADRLAGLDAALTDLLVRLSRGIWGRSDRAAVLVIRDCVVELPTALLLRGSRTPDAATRARLSAAVRGVLSVGPPEPSPSADHD